MYLGSSLSILPLVYCITRIDSPQFRKCQFTQNTCFLASLTLSGHALFTPCMRSLWLKPLYSVNYGFSTKRSHCLKMECAFLPRYLIMMLDQKVQLPTTLVGRVLYICPLPSTHSVESLSLINKTAHVHYSTRASWMADAKALAETEIFHKGTTEYKRLQKKVLLIK